MFACCIYISIQNACKGEGGLVKVDLTSKADLRRISLYYGSLKTIVCVRHAYFKQQMLISFLLTTLFSNLELGKHLW